MSRGTYSPDVVLIKSRDMKQPEGVAVHTSLLAALMSAARGDARWRRQEQRGTLEGTVQDAQRGDDARGDGRGDEPRAGGDGRDGRRRHRHLPVSRARAGLLRRDRLAAGLPVAPSSSGSKCCSGRSSASRSCWRSRASPRKSTCRRPRRSWTRVRARAGSACGRTPIDLLPKGRDFTSLVSQAPGANQEPKLGGISIDGSSAGENRFVINGIETTNLFSGVSGHNVLPEFVDEIQVKSSGYTAEYGGSTGGVINVVTKSGTNTWTRRACWSTSKATRSRAGGGAPSGWCPPMTRGPSTSRTRKTHTPGSSQAGRSAARSSAIAPGCSRPTSRPSRKPNAP